MQSFLYFDIVFLLFLTLNEWSEIINYFSKSSQIAYVKEYKILFGPSSITLRYLKVGECSITLRF